MRVDVEQDVRATWPREMVLEFVRQPQRIQGNRPFDRVRGWPSAWRHGEREGVSYDSARGSCELLQWYAGDAAYVYKSSKSVIAHGYGGPALKKRSKHRDMHSACSA